MMVKKSLKVLAAGVLVTLGLVSGVQASTQTIDFTITVQEAGKGFTINTNGASDIKVIQDAVTSFNLQGREVGTQRNKAKIGATITNDQVGEDGDIFVTLSTVDPKLTEVSGVTPTEGQVSVLTKNIAGDYIELEKGIEVGLGTLADNETVELDFDIYFPADVIDQASKVEGEGIKSETYNFVVTYLMR